MTLACEYACAELQKSNCCADKKLTELVNELIEQNESWSDSIKEIKKKQGYKCLLLGTEGNKELRDF